MTPPLNSHHFGSGESFYEQQPLEKISHAGMLTFWAIVIAIIAVFLWVILG
jgi:hypothetical protein